MSDQTPEKRCSTCGVRIVFVINAMTGRSGPIEPGGIVYVLDTSQPPAETLSALTLKEWQSRVDKVVMRDGSEVPIDRLKFYPSHFGRCPQSAQHSRRNQ